MSSTTTKSIRPFNPNMMTVKKFSSRNKKYKAIDNQFMIIKDIEDAIKDLRSDLFEIGNWGTKSYSSISESGPEMSKKLDDLIEQLEKEKKLLAIIQSTKKKGGKYRKTLKVGKSRKTRKR